MKEQLPTSTLERAQLLQNVLLARATGGNPDEAAYQVVRRGFIEDQAIRDRLPSFVRSSRDLSQFWAYIKTAAPTYAERRAIIYQAFQPFLDHIELAANMPSDGVHAAAVNYLDSAIVAEIWAKAISRRTTDPEGAITSARQLLESVCKHILEDLTISYPADADLPKLWALCSEQLNLAPSQHNEKVFKAILGNSQSIVSYIGSIRNSLGDAHGAGRGGYRPAPRHAALAVNLAGTMATFLIETYLARAPQVPDTDF